MEFKKTNSQETNGALMTGAQNKRRVKQEKGYYYEKEW